MSDYIQNIVRRAVGSESKNIVLPYLSPSFIPKPQISYYITSSDHEGSGDNEENTGNSNPVSDKQISTGDPVILKENAISHRDQNVGSAAYTKNEKEQKNSMSLHEKKIEDTSILGFDKSSEPVVETGKQLETESRNNLQNKVINKPIQKNVDDRNAKIPAKKESAKDQEQKQSSTKPSSIPEEVFSDKKNEKSIIEKEKPIKYKFEEKISVRSGILSPRKSWKIHETPGDQLHNVSINKTGITNFTNNENGNKDEVKVTIYQGPKALKTPSKSHVFSISPKKQSIEPADESSKPSQQIKVRSEKNKQSPIHITIGTIEVIAKNSNSLFQSDYLPKINPEGFNQYSAIRNYRIRS
jgi:hypothetical protein